MLHIRGKQKQVVLLSQGGDTCSAVLYKRECCSLTLIEEYTLRVFENRALGRRENLSNNIRLW